MENDNCVVCGQPSDYGAHGIKDREVYSEYFCEIHYNAKKRGSLETDTDWRSASEDSEIRAGKTVPSVEQPNHRRSQTGPSSELRGHI
jgi:hypothetical protein